MASPAPAPLQAPRRTSSRRRRRDLTPLWWVIVLAVAAGLILWIRSLMPEKTIAKVQSVQGYQSDLTVLDQEYVKFHGKALAGNEARKQFDDASNLAERGEYNGAILLLESLSKKAAVPVVFNDIGVLYAQLGDRSRAILAFRDALARDFDYVPVRQNLDRLRSFTSDSADPVTRELEPNNNHTTANVIGLDKPVEAEISMLDDDTDVFRVTSPPAPRDIIMITVDNHSKTLAPRLMFYDEEGAVLPWGKESSDPGGSISVAMAPKPNTTMYLHIFGAGSSSGAYTLTVKTTKAFDQYEPNDEIYSAHKIAAGQQVDANIMDAEDTDFYSFEAPRTGSVSIDIQNRSATLMPALGTFGPDQRSSGFGPDIRIPGDHLHHTMQVEKGNTYYLQVWSNSNSAGDYTLIVR